MSGILAHLIAVYVIVAAPWLGKHLFQRIQELIRSGVHDAKLQLYRGLVVEQGGTTLSIIGLVWTGAASAASLGVTFPRAWAWNVGASAVIGMVLVWSGLKFRSRSLEIKEKLRGAALLIPDTRRERPWFAAVSVGAGISEELAYRGFLLYYFTLYLPHLNTVEKVLLAAAAFGLAHLYQGWKGIVGTGILGGAFGTLYVLTGSLLLPMVLHAMVDLRALLIFPPKTDEAEPAAALA